MTTSEGRRDAFANKPFGVSASWAKSDNIWWKRPGRLLRQPTISATISRSKHVNVLSMTIRGGLPAQSDMNTIFCFLNAHAH
jgi:hypothetical protein